MHEIVWEFLPAPGCETEFVAVYGAAGAWAQLFRLGEGFLGTTLQPASDRPGWYRTTDRWRSEADHAAFLERFADAYRELDAACERLTAEERRA